MTNRRIVYKNADGVLCVCGPAAGARLATAIELLDGTVLRSSRPVPVDSFARIWPIEGATAVWAETEDEFVDRIVIKDIPVDATDVHVIDATDVPSDRSFREAWTTTGNGIQVDIDRARDIHRARIRSARDAELIKLDIAYIRADETGDTIEKNRIAAAKQLLRDAPAYDGIASASSLDELKALTLDAILMNQK